MQKAKMKTAFRLPISRSADYMWANENRISVASKPHFGCLLAHFGCLQISEMQQ